MEFKKSFYKTDPIIARVKLADTSNTNWRLMKASPKLSRDYKTKGTFLGICFAIGYAIENRTVNDTLKLRHL